VVTAHGIDRFDVFLDSGESSDIDHRRCGFWQQSERTAKRPVRENLNHNNVMASQINSTHPQTRRPTSATEQPVSRATQYVNQQLEKTRRGVKSNDLLAGLLTVFVGALAFMLTVALWDAWVAELSTTGRWLALIMLILGCLSYSTRYLLPLMIRRINPDYAAKMIEDAKPSFKNSLLNYVSLRRTDATISPAVLDAVSRQAASDLSTVPADATVDRSKLIRIGFALIGLMILIVGYKMLSPKDPLQTFGRILAPNAKIARPAVVRVSDVQPGDTQIFFGDTVEVTAVVRGSHQPGDVKIEFSTIDGERSRQTISMQTTEAKDRYRAQLSENGIGIGQSLTYRVVARDGSSPDYTIDVRPNPTIAVESLTLTPPAYTQLPKRTFSGSGAIEAVEGTEVHIEAVANLPIKVAYIELLEALPAPKANNNNNNSAATGNEYRVIRSIEMNATEKNAAASFIALLNAARDKPIATHYQIKFVSTNDDRNQKPNVYPIRIIPDLAPEITITHPLDRDIYLPQNGTLAIDIEASDLDYEISAIKLRIDHAATSLLDANLELRSSSANSRNDRVTARYQLTPEKLGLVAGDKAIFFATAADNRTSPHSGQPDPNIARTENFTLNVTSPEKPSDPNEQGSNEDDSNKQNPEEKSSDGENPDTEPSTKKGEGEEGSSNEGSSKQNGSEQMPNEQNGDQQNGDQQSGDQQSGDQQSGDQQQEGDQQNGSEQGSGEQGSGEQGSGEQGSGEQGSGAQGQPSSGGQSTDSTSDNDSASSGGPDNAGDSNQDSSSNQAPRESDSPNDNRSPSSNSGGNSDSQNGEQHDPNLQNGEKQPLGRNASDGERFKRLQEHYEQQQKENRGSNGSDGEKQSDQQTDKNQANENRAGEEDATDNSSSVEPNGDESTRDKAPGDKAPGEKASNEEPSDDQASGKGNTGDESDDSQSNSDQSDPPASKGDSSTGDPKNSERGDGEPKNGEPQNDGEKKGESENGSSDSNEDSAEQGGGEKQSDPNNANGESGSEESSSGDSSDQESGSPNPQNSQPSAEQNGSPSDPSSDSPDGQPMPGDSSSNQKSDSSSDKASAGDKATAGGSGSGSGELPSQQIEKEAANLQHAQQATDLILEKLDQQKYEPDQKLLDELNWTEAEMADFLKRWNAMKRAAESGDLGAKRKYEQALKSLGLRPEDGRRTVRQNEDVISGLIEDNAVIEPPPELAPDFNATLRDLNRSR